MPHLNNITLYQMELLAVHTIEDWKAGNVYTFNALHQSNNFRHMCNSLE